jgi:hypothetical protein
MKIADPILISSIVVAIALLKKSGQAQTSKES